MDEIHNQKFRKFPVLAENLDGKSLRFQVRKYSHTSIKVCKGKFGHQLSCYQFLTFKYNRVVNPIPIRRGILHTPDHHTGFAYLKKTVVTPLLLVPSR